MGHLFPTRRVKLKEIEKRDKYLDLARELKKLLNAEVIFAPNEKQK